MFWLIVKSFSSSFTISVSKNVTMKTKLSKPIGKSSLEDFFSITVLEVLNLKMSHPQMPFLV